MCCYSHTALRGPDEWQQRGSQGGELGAFGEAQGQKSAMRHTNSQPAVEETWKQQPSFRCSGLVGHLPATS